MPSSEDMLCCFQFEKLDKDRAGVMGIRNRWFETSPEMLNYSAGDGTQSPFFTPISDIACGHISIKYGFEANFYRDRSASAS
jgi:3-oxoacyl-[acyl-carrier-protein] synthase II